MDEAGLGQPGLDGVLHVGAAVGIGQRGRRDGERRVRLDGELVAGQVRRRESERLLRVGECLFDGLSRQAVHQVEVEIVEVMRGERRGAARLSGVVDAAERLELRRIEALDAERQAVDAGRTEGGELVGLDGAGVGFQRDLRVVHQRQAGADGGEQRVERLGGKQARRAAAEEDADDPAAPDERQRRFQVGDQRGDVLGFRQAVAQRMRIEVAVRALLHAPGNVHVERQRQRCAEFQRAVMRRRSRGRRPDRDDARGFAPGHARRVCSRSTSSASAWPRCDRRFFSAASSSATVMPASGRKK